MGYKTSRFELCLTTREKETLKRKARKVNLTVSDFMRSSLIHSDDLTIDVINTSVLNKTPFGLHKHGVNPSRLMKFCNIYGLDAFNGSHVIPTLENERTVFLQAKTTLLSLEEEIQRGSVMVNLEVDDDMEEEDSWCLPSNRGMMRSAPSNAKPNTVGDVMRWSASTDAPSTDTRSSMASTWTGIACLPSYRRNARIANAKSYIECEEIKDREGS